ncbi:MAG: hypothetical protein OHK93_000831 [Ramalina farinacea]|uniref:Uncharacterized protein n=1 Tax=Ramalina farinacea TaxID=258253 RepID=A0AA43QQD5_9LECA|nr:hypothetical protein [Ramalina farinacea]
MDDERYQLSIEISQARSHISLDRPTPAFSNHKTRSRSRTSLNRRPLSSPTSHHPRRATLPSGSLQEPQNSNNLDLADDDPAFSQTFTDTPSTPHISDHANTHSPVIDRKPLPHHPLTYLGAGRFYDPSVERKSLHHRLRERASWSRPTTKEPSPAWPPQATRDLLKEAGDWLDVVYPCPAPVEDGDVGPLQSPSSLGSFETLRGTELTDRVWTSGRGAVSLVSLVDDDKDSLRSAYRDHVDMDISKDDHFELGGDNTNKEFGSLPRKISMLRGEKIVVPSPPPLPSSPVRSSTGEERKPITQDDGRESKVKEQLRMLQGLNSAEGTGGSGGRHNEDHCFPDLAELDAMTATPREDVLAEAPIVPNTPSSECNGDTPNHDYEDEDSMSNDSPNERTPQLMPEYMNLLIDLGDEQFSTAIAEALGYDGSPAGEELTGINTIDDDQDNTGPGDARDLEAPVNACELKFPLTESAPNTTPLDDPSPAQSSYTREQDQCEPKLDHPKTDVQTSRPPTPVPESSSSEITLSKSQRDTAYEARPGENLVVDATALPWSPKSEKNATVGVFSDLEKLALASQRFTSPPAQSSTANALRTMPSR